MDRRAGGGYHPRRPADPDFRHHGRAARPRRLRLVVPGRVFASGGAGFLCHVGLFDRRRFAAPAGQDGPLSEAVYDRPLQPDLYRDGSGAGLWLRGRFHRPADISRLRDLRRRLLRRHLQPDQYVVDAAATTAHMGAGRPAPTARYGRSPAKCGIILPFRCCWPRFRAPIRQASASPPSFAAS